MNIKRVLCSAAIAGTVVVGSGTVLGPVASAAAVEQPATPASRACRDGLIYCGKCNLFEWIYVPVVCIPFGV